MKKLLSILFLSAGFFSANAQSTIANGAICPNITLTDSKGTVHKLYDYCNAGKYVVIDFFAEWCGPCKATAPFIDQFYKKYGCNSGNVIVLGNESDPATTLALLHAFETSSGLDPANTYPSTYGSIGGAANGTTYGVGAYPTIILIGPDKKMINNDVWPVSSIANIEAAFPASVLTPKACAAPASVNNLNNEIIVSITPNPSSDRIQIEADDITNIMVYNPLGAAVISENNLSSISNKSIDISSLANGAYFITIQTKAGNATRRIMKN